MSVSSNLSKTSSHTDGLCKVFEKEEVKYLGCIISAVLSVLICPDTVDTITLRTSSIRLV